VAEFELTSRQKTKIVVEKIVQLSTVSETLKCDRFLAEKDK